MQPRRTQEGKSVDLIRQELEDAGLSRYGSWKFSTRYLKQLIHSYEHIKGVVYGRYGAPGGFFGRLNEGMLIATDRRVIFLDHKPGYTDMKEFTYDVVSGIERLTAGMSSSVTLYTRIGDYMIRYANPRCVKRFMDYVELRRLESDHQGPPPQDNIMLWD